MEIVKNLRTSFKISKFLKFWKLLRMVPNPILIKIKIFSQLFLPKTQLKSIRKPPYSPDLAPCNFFIFIKPIRPIIQWRRFTTIKVVNFWKFQSFWNFKNIWNFWKFQNFWPWIFFFSLNSKYLTIKRRLICKYII